MSTGLRRPPIPVNNSPHFYFPSCWLIFLDATTGCGLIVILAPHDVVIGRNSQAIPC